MRNFMASLGGSGSGLFSPKGDDEVFSQGKWDIAGIPEEVDGGEGGRVAPDAAPMTAAKEVFSAPADGNPRSYSDAILRLPVAFYFSDLTGINLPNDMVRQPLFPGTLLRLYDAATPLPKMIRRSKHDTFRPPCGLAIEHLSSIGYGMEVGLPAGMQEVYDPITKC